MPEPNYNTTYDAIIIGGSWGGLHAVTHILELLPREYTIPVIVVLHRGKNYASDLESIFQRKVNLQVKEIEEKEKINPGRMYLAPANYHLLIEEDRTFSFDVFKPVNYSRPSIDVAFESAAEVFTSRLMGILLTGANKDGAQGLKTIAQKGGFTIVQDPLEAESSTMPKSALEISTLHRILTLDQMKALLIGLHALAM
jgi:two-component system chemotaxis response regulator CheB